MHPDIRHHSGRDQHERFARKSAAFTSLPSGRRRSAGRQACQAGPPAILGPKVSPACIRIDGCTNGGIISPQRKSGKTTIRRSRRRGLAIYPLPVGCATDGKRKGPSAASPRSTAAGLRPLPRWMEVHRLPAEGRLGVERPIQQSWISLYGFARYGETPLFST